MKNVPFREPIGGLQFISQRTRPNISHAVSIVSSFCSDPGLPHWTAAKRILRYLKGTKNYKLTYRKDAAFTGYSDADWGNDAETRLSISGYVFLQRGGAVSWSSKRQSTVALSTTEVEYMALPMASQEAVWWMGFLRELYGINDSLVINCDNKSSICLAEKETGYPVRTKHIDFRHHFVREQVELKAIKFKLVASNQQAADILTKALRLEDRKMLGVLQIPT
ncbi:uncharacterized protein LOC129717372 [Wyeomyia smithii]|uniref:uncharacterized protein LOC129717372 n=1 Tax=Wyeomyia smithii TaxID=174621 RepID=UPI002467BBE1|nr:uncharacterized protein LOC129717372 [Wyeomyia smithii]